MQALEETNVLNLHGGQEAVATPAMGRGDRLPDQAFTDLVMSAEFSMNAEAAPIPDPGLLLNDAHDTDNLAAMA